MTANTWRPATPPPPGGPPPMGWMAGSGNIGYMNTNDSNTGSFFFNTPASFCTGASRTASPVQPSNYKTTPVLALDSYTNSATATSGGNPDPGLWGDGTSGAGGGVLTTTGTGALTPGIYKWIMYDNENWAQTPTVEKQDPVTYMQDFIAKCHLHGYNAIMAPGYGLFATVTVHPPNAGETQEDWFVRVIVGMGAVGCDMFVLQNESQQGTATYVDLWNKTAAMMATPSVAPDALVFAEVASDFAQTGSLTGPQLGTSMATDAKKLTGPYPDGFYVAMPSTVTNGQAGGRYFLDDMKAAGYSAG